MTPEERDAAMSVIEKFDWLYAQRREFAKLHEIIEEWSTYRDSINRSKDCFFSNPSDVLKDLLNNSTTRNALFVALSDVIKEYDKQLSAL